MNSAGVPMGPSSSSSQTQLHYVPREGRYVGRRGDVKVKKKCIEVICQPSVVFLVSTICMTALASALLSYALTGQYWEMLNYDEEKIQEIVASNSTYLSVNFLFHGRVPQIIYEPSHLLSSQPAPAAAVVKTQRQHQQQQFADDPSSSGPTSPKYLLPLHSGLWISCIDLLEEDFKDLQQLGYNKVSKQCVDHLDPDSPKPKPNEIRASWQHRMQNLAIACAMVCLILLGAAVVVGLFGVLRPQISAVLVTGVIYVLSATFSLFTLTIVHFKHKNRHDFEPLDVWSRMIPELSGNSSEFRHARIISHGDSLQLAWAGSMVCVLASIMWILLSKMMRYNPISFST